LQSSGTRFTPDLFSSFIQSQATDPHDPQKRSPSGGWVHPAPTPSCPRPCRQTQSVCGYQFQGDICCYVASLFCSAGIVKSTSKDDVSRTSRDAVNTSYDDEDVTEVDDDDAKSFDDDDEYYTYDDDTDDDDDDYDDDDNDDDDGKYKSRPESRSYNPAPDHYPDQKYDEPQYYYQPKKNKKKKKKVYLPVFVPEKEKKKSK